MPGAPVGLGARGRWQKTNERKAIPAFLRAIDVKGAVVSVDAAGCYPEIAQEVRDVKADYLIGLKANQPSLMQAVEQVFVDRTPASHHVQVEKDHGRIEHRTCDVQPAHFLDERQAPWPAISSLVRIVAQRTDVLSGRSSEEIRFYISSLKADAMRFNQLVRQHWRIENQLHWTLDVTFNEDASRVRKGHGQRNMATVRRTALNICKLCNVPGYALKHKRLAASGSDEFRDMLLGF